MISPLDTIAAVATASGLGAIAVVRVSGERSREVAALLSGSPPTVFEPRKATLRSVRSSEGEEIDQALYTFFSAPNSFTGEDTLEISCHGGFATVRAVFEAVLSTGIRPAEPGEFTRRAFLNGKMDLAQAEAVNQLIQARTQTQMSAAKHSLDGALSRRVHSASEILTGIAAALEASIDFPEDVDEPDRNDLADRLSSVEASLAETLELARRGQLLSSGIRMAIAGRPNVGKSSLLNLMAGRPRAIVSDTPGTTRDFLEEQVEIGGIPILAIDTAGIRETDDPIEREGAKRAAETLESADVGLVVLDSTAGITHSDKLVLDSIEDRAVAVWNKVDLIAVNPDNSLLPEGMPSVRISALTGEGLKDLQDAVLRRLGAGAGYFEEALAASQRQTSALQQALESVKAARESVMSPFALDLAAVQIQAGRLRLCEITGENTTENLLDAIFGSFCIGK